MEYIKIVYTDEYPRVLFEAEIGERAYTDWDTEYPRPKLAVTVVQEDEIADPKLKLHHAWNANREMFMEDISLSKYQAEQLARILLDAAKTLPEELEYEPE